MAEATAIKDEDTCSGLAFKRKRKVDAAVPAKSASDDCACREHPPNASSPRDLMVQEGGGEGESGQSWRVSC